MKVSCSLQSIARAWCFTLSHFARRLERLAERAAAEGERNARNIEELRLRGIELDKQALIARQSATWIRVNCLHQVE